MDFFGGMVVMLVGSLLFSHRSELNAIRDELRAIRKALEPKP